MSTQNHITITSGPSENISENFDILRAEGLAYLQNIVGDIWTDYNLHDPGVSILEELCYAITDLGYRTNLDIKDILAINLQDDTEKDLNNFFTAREILMNAPFTINDYRKLLVDVNGINNAWFDLTRVSEIDFYADKFEKELTYENRRDSTQINLNGLYDVLLEFDESEKYGDLNDNTLSIEKTIKIGDLAGLKVEVSAEFPYWSDVWVEGKSWEVLADIKGAIKCINVDIEKSVPGFNIEINVSNDNVISATVVDTTITPYVEKLALAGKIVTAINSLFDITGTSDVNLLVFQQKKVEETYGIVKNGLERLHQNRNLCEDFVRFNALKIEEILICADIEITPESDTEMILAEIYFLIGEFLAPNINFYSIGELLEKGKSIEEIFDGPRLNHGFIDAEELEESSRKKSIHVSDLISIVMDIEGVIAVKEIQIANIPLGDSTISAKSALWCLELAWEKNFVPRLTTEKSKIVFIKKGIPFIANNAEVEELLEEKKATLRAQNNVILALDLEVPNGQYYGLEDYTSIQIDFPINYGIGEIGLSNSVSDQRKAQANQLKGFLLFFDQFLANYCSQLSHIKHLFSMNSEVSQTYFQQSLFDIPNVANLYKEFIDDANLGKNPANDNATDFVNAWEDFKALNETEMSECSPEELTNSHHNSLQSIIESKETFFERRNKFLDHLLGRFSEQFMDYTMLAYKLEGKKATEDLIEDKLNFLQEYPKLSYNRGQAFNYRIESWNTDNVSGLEKRICKLLGIENYSRRDLACPPIKKGFQNYKDKAGKWRFRFKNSAGVILLKSEAYNSVLARSNGIQSVMLNGVDIENYSLKKAENCTYTYHLKSANGQVIGDSGSYGKKKLRDGNLKKLVDQLKGECSGEGLYLIEHLLLRPRTDADLFLPVSFEEDCYCEGNEDAYSFRATCILPYWVGRFDNMDFRRFVERTIREEAPAHIFMKICWIDQTQMNKFQSAYKEWLNALTLKPVDQLILTETQNKLLIVLEELRNVYPISNLYDCQESDASPVRLGQSILGTFIPKENE